MNNKPNPETSFRALFVIGLIFMVIGVTADGAFLVIGITFFAIGLSGIERVRSASNETVSTPDQDD